MWRGWQRSAGSYVSTLAAEHLEVDLSDPSTDWTEPDGPVRQRVHPRPRLTGAQRRRVAIAALGPVALAALILLPFAVRGGYGARDVFVGAVVYGGLVGLAFAFVALDRAQAWQCPRCGTRHEQQEGDCAVCGYDLGARPRFTCEERHAIYLDEGTCECGRRLQPMGTVRGVGREVIVAIVVGAVLLGFLLAVGVILRLLES